MESVAGHLGGLDSFFYRVFLSPFSCISSFRNYLDTISLCLSIQYSKSDSFPIFASFLQAVVFVHFYPHCQDGGFSSFLFPLLSFFLCAVCFVLHLPCQPRLPGQFWGDSNKEEGSVTSSKLIFSKPSTVDPPMNLFSQTLPRFLKEESESKQESFWHANVLTSGPCYSSAFSSAQGLPYHCFRLGVLLVTLTRRSCP